MVHLKFFELLEPLYGQSAAKDTFAVSGFNDYPKKEYSFLLAGSGK